MSYNFKNLAEVELLDEVPEGCTAFAEVDGVVKRVPSKGLGGAGGIKTAIIKDSGYDNAIAGLSTTAEFLEYTYECINMTFEEAYQAMTSGEPLACFGMFTTENAPITLYGITMFAGSAILGIPCIAIGFLYTPEEFIQLYWTADGLSTEMPSSGNPPA